LNNDGVVTGNPVYNGSGLYGGAVEFDGDGDYVDVGSGVINNLAKFTFSFWYNPASSTQDNYAGILCTGANCYNNFRVSTGGTDGKELAFRSDNDLNILNFQTTNDIFPVNVWSHVAGTWNGTNYTWYVNGVKDTQTGGTIDGVVSSADSLDIGKYATTNFNGSIDEVMIFNRSLSAEQIKQLYIKGRAKFEYTPYQDNDYFEVDSSNTNFLVGYKFNAGNSSNPFYSPLLMTTASNPINITEDVGNPTVDLLTPSNGTTEASFGYYFAANFTDDAQLKNSTLWIWNSSGSVIVNQTSTIT